ncbi:MAG: hypothetical protein WEG56_08330 [Chloroflexota bacterium]
MTTAVVVFVAFRIAGSLPVLRWPLAGGLLAILVDLGDLLVRDLLGGVGDYQALDKWLDQIYLAAFLVVSRRWSEPARRIALALYLFRLIGFLAFELTGERALLLAFPNVFETWFLAVAVVGHGRVAGWSRGRITALLAGAAAIKLVHEWALHGARLFDGISSLEAIDLVWRRLTGG